MRDLFVLTVVYGSLPVILFRPFYGLLVYSWLAFMRPQDMAWGVGAVRAEGVGRKLQAMATSRPRPTMDHTRIRRRCVVMCVTPAPSERIRGRVGRPVSQPLQARCRR